MAGSTTLCALSTVFVLAFAIASRSPTRRLAILIATPTINRAINPTNRKLGHRHCDDSDAGLTVSPPSAAHHRTPSPCPARRIGTRPNLPGAVRVGSSSTAVRVRVEWSLSSAGRSRRSSPRRRRCRCRPGRRSRRSTLNDPLGATRATGTVEDDDTVIGQPDGPGLPDSVRVDFEFDLDQAVVVFGPELPCRAGAAHPPSFDPPISTGSGRWAGGDDSNAERDGGNGEADSGCSCSSQRDLLGTPSGLRDRCRHRRPSVVQPTSGHRCYDLVGGEHSDPQQTHTSAGSIPLSARRRNARWQTPTEP